MKNKPIKLSCSICGGEMGEISKYMYNQLKEKNGEDTPKEVLQCFHCGYWVDKNFPY